MSSAYVIATLYNQENIFLLQSCCTRSWPIVLYFWNVINLSLSLSPFIPLSPSLVFFLNCSDTMFCSSLLMKGFLFNHVCCLQFFIPENTMYCLIYCRILDVFIDHDNNNLRSLFLCYVVFIVSEVPLTVHCPFLNRIFFLLFEICLFKISV